MDTKIKSVEILPLVKYDMEELELARLFDKFVPNHNGAEIAPAQVLCMMIMHIMVSTTPLYRIEDWLHDYVDGVSEGRVERGSITMTVWSGRWTACSPPSGTTCWRS